MKCFVLQLLLCAATLSLAEPDSTQQADRNLLLILDVTVEGARSPLTEQEQLLNTTWDTGLGKLMPSGERQMYLFGQKIRKKYIEDLHFLPDEYDPRTVYARATQSDDTIMSQHAKLQGIYPLGKGKVFADDYQRAAALPPFTLSDEAQKIVEKMEVTPNLYDPIPIHVSKFEDDLLLRGHANIVCPMLEEIKKKSFLDADNMLQDVLQPLYDDFVRIFGLPRDDMNLEKAFNYVDTYYSGITNSTTLEHYLPESSLRLLNRFLG